MSKTPGSSKKGDEVLQRITKEEVYRDKCRNLKRKTSELEDQNTRLFKKLKKAKRIVARLRLERSFLFDKLEQYEAVGAPYMKEAKAAEQQQQAPASKQPSKGSAAKPRASAIKHESRHATPAGANGGPKTATQPKVKKEKTPKPTPASTNSKEDAGSAADNLDIDLNKHLARPASKTKPMSNEKAGKDADQHMAEAKEVDMI